MRLALKPVAPDAEARKALALAIAEARERQADADKARASFDRVNRLASEAGTAVELAHSAFETVVAEEGVRLSALLIDASGAPVKVTSAPMRAARERLVDLEDQLAAAKAAREQMRDLVAEPEAEAAMAKTKVEKAKAAVIALHLDPWVQLVERLHAELVSARALLWEAKSSLHCWSDDYKRVQRILDNESLMRRDGTWDRCAPVLEWRRAMAALSEDANAPIPAPAGGR